MPWSNILLVAAGGSLGALSRWALSAGVKSSKISLGPYPLSILIVNAIGCYLASKWTMKGYLNQSQWSLTLGVGFLGAFTTLSALNLEVAEFVRGGQLGQGILYLFIHLSVCAIFSALGFAL